MDISKGSENRTSIRKGHEDRTSEPLENRDSYFDGDARRELESTRHSKEPHVVELPLCDSENKQASRVPVAAQVSVRHSAENPLTDVLPQTATDALAEAANRSHAHVDRARSGGSTIVK